MFDRVFNAFSTFGRRREKNNSFSENFAWINEWILNEYVLNEWILILEETLAYLYRKRHSLKSRLDSDSRPYTCHWSTILCHAHITRLQKKLIQNNDLDVDFDCLYLLTRGSWMCDYWENKANFPKIRRSFYRLLLIMLYWLDIVNTHYGYICPQISTTRVEMYIPCTTWNI